jgi:hypothetical protein
MASARRPRLRCHPPTWPVAPQRMPIPRRRPPSSTRTPRDDGVPGFATRRRLFGRCGHAGPCSRLPFILWECPRRPCTSTRGPLCRPPHPTACRPAVAAAARPGILPTRRRRPAAEGNATRPPRRRPPKCPAIGYNDAAFPPQNRKCSEEHCERAGSVVLPTSS